MFQSFVLLLFIVNHPISFAQNNRDNNFSHSLSLCQDGTVIGFGNNERCQMGSGSATSTPFFLPQNIPSFGNGAAVAVSVGENHSMALLDDGSVWAWGANDFGSTGQPPSTLEVCQPAEVSLPGCAVAISAGRHFSLALLADGTIYSWGLDNYGQLGNDIALTNKYQAQKVDGITTAIAISAGGEHAMALLSGGTVKVWGKGSAGQMGNGTTVTANPVPVTASATGFSDIVKIAAGYDHCMALKSNNDVYLWGENYNGQLGRGNPPNPAYTSSAIPLKSSGMSGGNIIDISAGNQFSLVLRNDNKTRVCGANGRYEIGICRSTTKLPQPLFGPQIANAKDLWTPSTGSHTLCVTSTGKLYGWGGNFDNQLGIGGTPTKVCAPGVLINDASVIGEDGYYCLAKPSEDNHPQPCCVAIQGDKRTKIGNGTVITSGTVNHTGNFALQGTLTLNGGILNFDAADVVCEPGSKIIVNGGWLIITGASHLYACSQMWEGIEVKNGSILVINQESIIEDAETAIGLEYGAAYLIEDAIFNKNYTHINKRAPNSGTPTYTGDYPIKRSRFLCQTTASIPLTTPVHTNLLAPHATQRSNVAIAAVGVPKILLGSSLATDANEVDNCEWGMFNWTVGRVEVLHNTFQNIGNGGVYSAFGPGNGGETIDINYNEFYKMPYPILCHDNKATVRTRIKNNTIDFAGMVSPPQVMTGITYQEIAPATGSNVNYLDVSHNVISKAPCGINLINLKGALHGGGKADVYVGDNEITHQKIPNDGQAGIKTSNVSAAAISNNTISHYTGNTNWWETAIRISSGSGSTISCNRTFDIGRGLFVDNDIRYNSAFEMNEMTGHDDGFFLNNAIIGAQVSGIGNPFDNKWLGSWGSVPGTKNHIQTYGSGSNGTYSPFTTQSGYPYEPTNIYHFAGALPVPPPTITSNTWPNGCEFTSASFKTSSEDMNRVDEAVSIATGERETASELQRAMLWNAQYGLYRHLQEDADLLEADPAIAAFFAQKDAASMGQLYRAIDHYQQLRNGQAETIGSNGAISELQAVTTDLQPERTLKQVLGVLLAHASDLADMGADNEALLRDVAQRCPIDDGFGVYMARAALLKLDTLPKNYVAECERAPSPDQMSEKRSNATANEGFVVYPNPTTGVLTIEYNLDESETATLSIYDLAGSLLLTRPFSTNAMKMNVALQGIASGLYLFQIDVDGQKKSSQRISVVRP